MDDGKQRLEVEYVDGVTVMTFGPVELYALDLRQEITDVVNNADPPLIVIDLSNVVYLASSFLANLMLAWRIARSRSGHIALCACHPATEEVLNISRANHIFTMYPRRRDAVAQLQKAWQASIRNSPE